MFYSLNFRDFKRFLQEYFSDMYIFMRDRVAAFENIV